MIDSQTIRKAAERIQSNIRETPFIKSKAFSEITDAEVWFTLRPTPQDT